VRIPEPIMGRSEQIHILGREKLWSITAEKLKMIPRWFE
jgi:hypothetical protein